VSLKTPSSIASYEHKYKADAWNHYSIGELGGIVAFFVKRASHRTDRVERDKDLTDAQNYLDMMQAHVTAAKTSQASAL
jgi:hypothetical protein